VFRVETLLMGYSTTNTVFTVAGGATLSMSFHWKANATQQAQGWGEVFNGPMIFAPQIEGGGPAQGEGELAFGQTTFSQLFDSNGIYRYKYNFNVQNTFGNAAQFKLAYVSFS
jgi:hypothetical protein